MTFKKPQLKKFLIETLNTFIPVLPPELKEVGEGEMLKQSKILLNLLQPIGIEELQFTTTPNLHFIIRLEYEFLTLDTNLKTKVTRGSLMGVDHALFEFTGEFQEVLEKMINQLDL